MKKVTKIIGWLLAAAVLAGLIFYFEADLKLAYDNLLKITNPCGRPIEYSLGEIDKRFGLSEADFLKAVAEAAAIWEKAAGKKLFSYSVSGALKINLIYDQRQAATDKLRSLGINISNDKASYETLKSKYDAFNATYQTQKTELDNMVNYYNEQKANYDAEVKAANRRGGVTPDEAAILEEERKSLNLLADKITQKQTALNQAVEQLNAVASVINRLISQLNLNVKNYNTVGATAAGEFQEGVYISDDGGERINLYQFDNRAALVKLLAHELGHAIGLEHVDDPKAIMYRLNEAGNDQPTAADLAELKRVCKIN